MTSTLKIFVAKDCPGCSEAQAIALRITQNYPHLNVEVVDINNAAAVIPERVFATPTYVLDDRIVSLGNPGPDDIAQWVTEMSRRQR